MKTKLVFVMALAALAGCDYINDSARDQERKAVSYRTAMADYQAGRLSQAVVGLQQTCAADPANASARFQLACLLQDSEKDYIGAFCAYREYLILAPQSDKAKLAKDRLVGCEVEVAKTLAHKHGLDKVDQEARALKALRAKLAETQQELDKATKELAEKTRRITALEGEVDRVKALLREEGETAGEPFEIDRSIFEDDDDASSARRDIDEAKRLLAEDDADAEPESMDEAKELLEEMTDTPPMIVQAPDAKEKREAARQAAEKAKTDAEKLLAEKAAKLEPMPKNGIYTVQEGDSLYKIANRFYGKTTAWRAIRDANKATISTDGRVKAGQKIVLPPVVQ